LGPALPHAAVPKAGCQGLANTRHLSETSFGGDLVYVTAQGGDTFRGATVGQNAVDLIAANGQHIGHLIKYFYDVAIVHSLSTIGHSIVPF
jgi:hypothetical protein